jgi:hypothetical protein
MLPQGITKVRAPVVRQFEDEQTQHTPLSTDMLWYLHDAFLALEKRVADLPRLNPNELIWCDLNALGSWIPHDNTHGLPTAAGHCAGRPFDQAYHNSHSVSKPT